MKIEDKYKQVKKIVETLIIILIILISAFLSYSFLNRFSFIATTQILEKTNYLSPNIYINNELIENTKIKVNKSNKTKIIEENIVNNYYVLNYKNKDFLLSNDEKSYNYGFISKNYVDKVLYLYSHNSYKQTENSGYYLYNHLSLGNEVTFNNEYKYKIVKTLLVDINKGEEKNIEIDGNVNIVYFTCTPYGDNIRKVFYLESIL